MFNWINVNMKKHKMVAIRIILIAAAFFLGINVNGQNLEKHRWENRIVIVKTSEIKAKKFQDQLKEFENSYDELMDRKIIGYQISGDDFVMIDYKNSTKKITGKIDRKLAEKLFNPKDDFEVLLIGLDGGIKLRQTDVLKMEDLYKRIDSMPMRKEELRKKRG